MTAARRTGDPNRLALALSQRFRALWRGPQHPEQAVVADEMRALAAADRLTPGLTAVAHLVHALTALMRGDAVSFERATSTRPGRPPTARASRAWSARSAGPTPAGASPADATTMPRATPTTPMPSTAARAAGRPTTSWPPST